MPHLHKALPGNSQDFKTIDSNNANTTKMLNRIFTPFPILTTQRLSLRQLIINDEQEIFTLRSDCKINKYLDRQLSNNISDARNFINNVNENIHKNVSLYWAITVSDTNIMVGTICLYGFSDENDNCEIGYELLTKFQGQGMMKEAVEKVIDYAFNTIKVQKIEAFLHRDNQRSINLLEKLLFRKSNNPDGTMPELICYHLTNCHDYLK
jgi:ribosomal-protein-alanine N-acetyltransferase